MSSNICRALLWSRHDAREVKLEVLPLDAREENKYAYEGPDPCGVGLGRDTR